MGSNGLNGATPPSSGASEAPAPQAPLVINAQYLKDLSFESPGAPQSLGGGSKNPEINIHLDVEVRPLSGATYESTLKIKAHAKSEEKTVFIADIAYAGVFTLQSVPENQHRPVLIIEGARLLFPFARAILANATRDGGFPPLMLGPIDFADMFRRSQAQQGQNQQTTEKILNA